MSTLAAVVDDRCRTMRPSSLVFMTAAATLGVVWTLRLIAIGELPQRVGRALWSTIHRLIRPLAMPKVYDALQGLHFPTVDAPTITTLPKVGWSSDHVLAVQRTYHEGMDGDMGKVLLSGVVYWGSINHHDLMAEVVKTQLWSNALFPDYFGASRRLEADVVRIVLNLFHAPHDAAATFTGGGTESILLSMLAYRNAGRERGIARPEVVLCRTAHQAFDKAAEYFGLRLVKVNCDPVTRRANVAEMRKCITPRTVCVVGSAPSYAYGIVDDLPSIAALAEEFCIGMHVDACLGGFLTAFLEDAGFDACWADFRLSAVTSISCDLHKWGGTPKGASMAMFRSRALRHNEIFVSTDNPGGVYTTSGISGSRPGFAAAVAWATLLRSGRQHYVDTCRTIVRCCQRFSSEVRRSPHLRVAGEPTLSVVAMTSTTVDVYRVMEVMNKAGYRMTPLQFPAGIHLGLTLEHAQEGVLESLLKTLNDAAETCAKEGGAATSSPHLYGTMQRVPDRHVVGDVLRAYNDLLHAT